MIQYGKGERVRADNSNTTFICAYVQGEWQKATVLKRTKDKER